MHDIFISYRRDDSAGHAGRLFDGLRAHFGAEHVYMDVTDLRPGQDFAAELERAVGRADGLLAVIGPRWLQAADAAGRRRIDDPDDFVRREIALALANGATVVPVLVHGAALPRAAELPAPLQALVQRQAVELSDPRWESDLRELLRALSASDAVAAPAAEPPPAPRAALAARPGFRFAAAGLAGLALLAGGAWFAFRPASPPAAAALSETVPLPVPVPARTTAPRFSIALPPLTEVRFRTSRAQVVFTLLAIRQQPRDDGTQLLSLRVRMLNRGPADEYFGSDQFRLIAGERSIAPSDTLIGSTDGVEAKETTLRFVAPADRAEVALEVRLGTDSTRLPIALAARTPIADDPALDEFGQRRPVRVVDAVRQFPVRMAVDREIALGRATYRVTTAVVERETVEKASLAVTVRCSPARGSGGVSFGSGTVRLWIDGLPRAPVNRVNLAVDPGDSQEAVFVFELSALPATLQVGVRQGTEDAKVALPLDALTGR